MGKMRDDSEVEEEVFLMFAREEDNEKILKKHQQLKEEELAKILQLKVESVVSDIEAIVGKKKPFSKDVDYDKRRKDVIDELVSNNRLVFFGENANKLGESTLKNFLKVCKQHSEKNHLKNYSFDTILKIFRRWFFPGRQELISKHLRKCSPDFRLKELNRKKKTMEKLRIQHEILLKKSQLMTIQEEIEQIEKEITPSKKPKCKVEEESQEQEQEVTYPSTEQKSKPITAPTAPVYSVIQSQDKFIINKNVKPKLSKDKPTILTPPPQSRDNSSSKEWTNQQQKFFISLLSKTSVRNHQILIGLMQQQFGKNPKFNPDSFKNKKAMMFRACKGRFLQAVKKKNLLNKADYQQLKAHFQSLNLLRSYKFVTFFMNRYYYIVFESQSDRVLRDIIDQVYKQPIRNQKKFIPNDETPRMVIIPSKHPRKMIIDESEYKA